MAGFEPTTSCSQSRRDTGLRYIPNLVSIFQSCFKSGSTFCRDGRIRTYDLLLPKQARYRATLHPELGIFFFYFPFSKGLQRNGFKLIIPFLFANFYFLRRGRDSNPRYRYQYDSLANCSFRPLRHLSFQPPFSALPALF